MNLVQVPSTDPGILLCLEEVLGELPDNARLSNATFAWLAVSQSGDVLGACVVEKDTKAAGENAWHVWLLAVRAKARCRGIGSRFLAEVEQCARKRGIQRLRTRTYQRWKEMRRLLERAGWAIIGAEPAERHEGVAEDWALAVRPDPLRVVVVGAHPQGRGGEWISILRSMPDLIALAGICDSDPEVRAYWSDVKASDDLKALIDLIKPDAAILALPHHAYPELRRVCIEAGLAILHEKPLACRLEQLMALQAMITERPVPFVVGVQRRAHPSYLYLRQQLKTSVADTMVIEIRLGRQDAAVGWRESFQQAGGGALLDIGYHAVDLAHFLLDAPLQVIDCALRTGDRPSLSGEVETRAILTGRCGPTWVKVIADRMGSSKEEHVSVRIGCETWTANRDVVRCGDHTVYECPGSWDAAVRGSLTRLALACLEPANPVELWDHLAVLQVIETAYAQAAIVGMTSAAGGLRQ